MSKDPTIWINEVRQRILRGEQISIEEAKEVVQLLRKDRQGVGGEGKTAALPPDLNSLFD